MLTLLSLCNAHTLMTIEGVSAQRLALSAMLQPLSTAAVMSLCWFTAVCLAPPMYTCLHPCSCFTYDGSQCTTVFGQANLTLGGADFVFLLDREIYQIISFLSITYDQSCLNHNRLIWCMVAYFPCTGSAWCGSNSKDELKIAVASACMCNNPDSCNINGFNISSLIDMHISSQLLPRELHHWSCW